MTNRFTKKTPSSAKQITKAKPKRKASIKCTSVKSTAKNKNKVKRNALHRLGGEYAKATQEETKKPSKKTTKPKAKTSLKATPKVGQAKRVEKPPNGFIPWGRTLTTKDNYLGKQKTGSTKTRPVVVVETNSHNELAVVPLSSRKGTNRTELKGYENPKTKQKTYYKHYLEIEDDEGNPIKVNDKFKENHKNMDVSKSDVDKIRSTIFTKSSIQQRNNKLIKKFRD